MRTKNIIIKNKCFMSNINMKGLKCPSVYLCCNFCSIKNCDFRCNDNYEDCKYLMDSSYPESFHTKNIIEEPIIEKPKSKRGRPKKITVSHADIENRRKAGRNI